MIVLDEGRTLEEQYEPEGIRCNMKGTKRPFYATKRLGALDMIKPPMLFGRNG